MKYYKRFGTKRKEDNLFIKVTTFDGKEDVIIITPKNPTKKQKEETINFLLHELDDHDGYNEYLQKLKEVENEK